MWRGGMPTTVRLPRVAQFSREFTTGAEQGYKWREKKPRRTFVFFPGILNRKLEFGILLDIKKKMILSFDFWI